MLTLAAAGEGAVVADNAEVISDMLATYNAGIPGPSRADTGGFCSLRPRSAPFVRTVSDRARVGGVAGGRLAPSQTVNGLASGERSRR